MLDLAGSLLLKQDFQEVALAFAPDSHYELLQYHCAVSLIALTASLDWAGPENILRALAYQGFVSISLGGPGRTFL